MALYHSAKGSVDYTIVGSPTIVDGVVSDFGGSSYLRTTEQLPSPNKLEIIVSINTKTIPTNRNDWFIGCPSASNRNIVWGITSSKQMRLFLSSNGTSWDIANGVTGTYSFSDDTSYLMRLTFDGQEYNAYISSDNGLSWVQDIKATSSLQLSSQYIDIGINELKGVYFWTGSIDLNHTYITVNGQPWFGIFPMEVKKHQIIGPVGYTVSGSPSTENGVLKNVSRTNRVYTSLSLPNFETLEVLIKAKKETSWTGRVLSLCGFGSYNSQRRITTNEQTGENQGTRLFFNAAGIIISIDNSKFDVTQYAPLGYYTRLRVTKNTEDYTYELGLSADKESWVTASANYEDNICTGQVYFLQNASGVYAEDEMSLDETYIKVNGKLWFWQPQETKYIQRNNRLVWADPRLYLSGPINYEVVGTPTITDGVVSGFTSVSALKINALLPDGDIEAKFDFTMGDTVEYSGTQTIFSFDGLFGISKSNYGTLASLDYRANSWRTVVPAADLTAKSHYVVQVTRTGTTYSFSYSKDGGPFVSSVTYNSTGGTPSTNNFIGSNLNMADRYFTGTINLNNSFVKANGELWFFGKNYASQNIAPVPSGYTFGTTTTSSIGYVDMRTQQFTAAPQGTILGRNE